MTREDIPQKMKIFVKRDGKDEILLKNDKKCAKSERNVQIANPQVLKMLRDCREANEKEINNGSYFFVNRRGDRYTEQSIRRILGHSSIKTTQIYIHVASKKQKEILRDMHPRNKMKIQAA